MPLLLTPERLTVMDGLKSSIW